MVATEKTAYCRKCQTERHFSYIGSQPNPVRGIILDLYNCDTCGDTHVLDKRPITMNGLEKTTAA